MEVPIGIEMIRVALLVISIDVERLDFLLEHLIQYLRQPLSHFFQETLKLLEFNRPCNDCDSVR